MQPPITKPHKTRPPSYSDSFVFLPSAPAPLVLHSLNADPPLPTVTSYPGLLEDPLLQPSPSNAQLIPLEEGHLPIPNQHPLRRVPSESQFSTFSIPASFSSTEKWTTRFLGFGVHLSLVSLFETLFFFLFISKSEDSGLQNMIGSYIHNIVSTCNTWSPETTTVVNDILTTFINRNATLVIAATAAQQRAAFNHTLFVQAWLYVVGLGTIVALGTAVARCRHYRIAWRRVLLENLIMVSLLGLYELTFFKTIIYNYENISLPELDGYIVTQLHDQCGLLTHQ
jgi:hypothetical protein